MAEETAVLVGLDYRSGNPIQLSMVGGIIREIRPLVGRISELPWLAPGLVDLQVNGFAGHDLNTGTLTPETVIALCRTLVSYGVTQFLATLVTNRDEAILTAVGAIRTAMEQNRDIAQLMPGIHLEGPFLSTEDGPRGAHDLASVSPPDWSRFESWQEASGGRIRLITLSPEWAGSVDFIDRCVRHGVQVAIGHTAANTQQIEAAVDAGASLSTHLGNGAHPWLRRHPNYIWDQLAHDGLWASVIADGYHLPRSVLKVMLRVKGAKLFLVSDTVALAGLRPGPYQTQVGGHVVLTPEGRLQLASHPDLLAGSVQPLLNAIKHMVESGLCTWREAWDLASIRPSQYLNLPTHSGLSVGAPADVVVYANDDAALQVLQTYRAGNLVYASDSRWRTTGGVKT